MVMEFHISRNARERYKFDQALFSINGNVIFANFHSARQFAQQINDLQDLINFPERAIKAGQINALGLIDEIFHFIFHEFLKENKPDLLNELLVTLENNVGNQQLNNLLLEFTDQFPPIALYKNEISKEKYIEGETEGKSNKILILEELLMLWLTNKNPATTPFNDLVDDSLLKKTTAYKDVIKEIDNFLKDQKPFGPDNQDIISMLRAPAINIPHSLSGQLDYIRTKWGRLLGSYIYRLLGSLDLIKEEQRLIFLGPGPTIVPDIQNQFGSFEEERFSPDSDWMPKVVMMAKNTYVWLNQLSKQYNRPITHLDHIPDETLDELARWGFTGLWLIGLWERSDSSKRIKQMCGNPDAVASAYSLSRYEIAWDLGGESSYQNLKERAAMRGIRLASDMVPNHMGIDSSWIYDHPDWFVSLDYSPFPSYSYNGPDLSQSPDVSINLEDHYYNRRDAAVVFKHYDHRIRETKYIYHGNDGTSMPWNDTAQLNYLKPEVREAVIQTILSVARKFPIIRFDAAMTLTKKHYQRLWFPQPGTGGDIPSRADHSLTKEDFDHAMPNEFWREVVDRVAAEVPDTLLLAEAFWLMEGYFVRTLGMHRVYNSAFMNMLRNEENEKYHQLITSTLEFDPQILKRYVNFMNNPDERTAVEQFGKGDKYFGICTLMSTLPGLPMFGHGQIEGYAEKYGMEYYRAYWDEYPDIGLVQRHEHEIFPILHKRYLFADVENFRFFNFFNSYGEVDNNVFALTNGTKFQRALVVFHNKFAHTAGWIKNSTGHLDKDNDVIIHENLYSSLNLRGSSGHYVIFRDYASGLEFIRSSQEIKEKGMYFELDAYKCQVFLDIFEVADDSSQKYARLNYYLNGRGVPSIEEALNELTLSNVLTPLRSLINPENLKMLSDEYMLDPKNTPNNAVLERFSLLHRTLLQAVENQLNKPLNIKNMSDEFENLLSRTLALGYYNEMFGLPDAKKFDKITKFVQKGLIEDPNLLHTLLIWVSIGSLGGRILDPFANSVSRSLIDEWGLHKITSDCLVKMGKDSNTINNSDLQLKILISQRLWYFCKESKSPLTIMKKLLNDEQVRTYLQINRYKDILWFNKEKFNTLLWLLMTSTLLTSGSATDNTSSKHIEECILAFETIKKLIKVADSSGYQVSNLVDILEKSEKSS